MQVVMNMCFFLNAEKNLVQIKGVAGQGARPPNRNDVSSLQS